MRHRVRLPDNCLPPSAGQRTGKRNAADHSACRHAPAFRRSPVVDALPGDRWAGACPVHASGRGLFRQPRGVGTGICLRAAKSFRQAIRETVPPSAQAQMPSELGRSAAKAQGYVVADLWAAHGPFRGPGRCLRSKGLRSDRNEMRIGRGLGATPLRGDVLGY